MTEEMATETVEMCPYCMSENVFRNWDAQKQGFVAKCWQCGQEIMLCDECLHSDDNRTGRCDWHGVYANGREIEGRCFRGVTHRKAQGRAGASQQEQNPTNIPMQV